MDATIEKIDIQASYNGNDAVSGLDKLYNSLDKISKITDKVTTVTERSSAANVTSKVNFSKLQRVATTTAKALSKCFDATNDYVESINLFNVAMGTGAEKAEVYAKTIERLMGIDSGDWMNYQGSFNQIFEGYGIADEKANSMSQQLTQLAYDLSSLWNVDVDTAFQKIQSGMSGQIKGLKVWGYNLSIASLRETALAHGIELSTAKMTEAQKATLRYITLMEAASNAQGDLSRTLVTPANSIRILDAQFEILKRTVGQIISDFAVDLIPVVQVMIQWLTALAEHIAVFFEYDMPEIDYSGIGVGADYADDLTDSLDESTKSAEKLKKTILGIDEINKLSDSKSSVSNVYGGGYAPDFGIDLSQYEYDFLGNLDTSKVDELKKKLEKILPIIASIGAAFGAWKISEGLIKAIKYLDTLKSKNFSFSFSIIGLSLFLADIIKFKEFLEDFSQNGPTFENVSGMITTFAGMVGDALILLGNVRLGGALKIIQGFGEIVSAVADISKNGPDFDNVTRVISGLSNVAIGIGLFTKNTKLTGAAMAIQGLTVVIEELATNWEAIKKGDWSGVDKAALAVAAIEVVVGIATALGAFKKLPSFKVATKTADTLKEIGTATENIDVGTSSLTPKLTSLVKNLGLGIVVIAEVAIAAGIFVGAIWGIGLMLEQVGKAWEPVINNGETIAIAIGVGTGILVAVGVAAGLLGVATTSSAGTLPLAIGLGTLMLVEVGAAAALFVAEIWLIGEELNSILLAWNPVMAHEDTITFAISKGTSLLIAIGVVTAALGVASVASVGLLPLAIALGTAMLAQLANGFIEFCDSLIIVAEKLNELSVPLSDLNLKLPGLKNDMDSFTKFMGNFALAIVAFTASSAIAGVAATIDKVIDFFLEDPVTRMKDEVTDQTREFENLISALDMIIPLIEKATGLVGDYKEKMGSFEKATGQSGTFLGSIVGGAKNVVNGLIGLFEGMANGIIKCINFVIGALNKISVKIPSYVPKIGGQTFGFNISTINEISIPRLAEGGFVDNGQVFIANEAGPELVGSIGKKTAVANTKQIVEGISGGVASGNTPLIALMQEQNQLIKKLLEKENTVHAVVSTSDITSGIQRKNRRDGKVIIPAGG